MTPRVACLIILGLSLAACQSSPPPQTTQPPSGNGTRVVTPAAIIDAKTGGNPYFVFLPPISNGANLKGAFETSFSPTVEVCRIESDTGCAPIGTFNKTDGPPPQQVKLSADGSSYQVNWNTQQLPADPNFDYRVRVLLGPDELGHADIDIVSNGAELANVLPGYVGLVSGSTLPIRFRISDGMLGQPSVPVRLEVTPEAVLLTGTGQTQRLKARLYDASGRPARGTVTWSSDDPSSVSVSADGTVTAAKNTGSALITAAAGGIETTVMVLIAQPAGKAVLVTDRQVIGEPMLVDPNVRGVGALVQVTVDRRDLTPGQILLAAGGKPIAGRVVGVSPKGRGAVVVYERVPLTQLFRTLDVNVSTDVSDQPLITDSSSGVTVQANGSLRYPASDFRILSAAANETTFTVGPFKCTATGEVEGLTSGFTVTPITELGFDFVLAIVESEVTAFLTRADGTLGVKAEGGLQVGATFEGEVVCEYEFGKIPLNYFVGALGAVFRPVLPLGMAVEMSGEVSATAYSLSIEGEAKASVRVGAAYQQDQGWTNLSKFTKSADATPKLILPQDENWNAQASLGLPVGWLKIAVDDVFDDYLPEEDDLEFAVLRLGPYQDLALASTKAQVLDNAEANYALRFKGKVEAGGDVQDVAEWIFGEEVPIPLSYEPTPIDLATSPAGSASVDKAFVQAGETAIFTVVFEPEKVTYPVVGYNVAEVHIYRKVPDGPGMPDLVLVASTLAPSDAIEVAVPWTPTQNVTFGQDFYAFVVTKGLPHAPLKLAQVEAPQAQGFTGSFTYTLSESSSYYDKVDNSTMTGYVETISNRSSNESFSGQLVQEAPEATAITVVQPAGGKSANSYYRRYEKFEVGYRDYIETSTRSGSLNGMTGTLIKNVDGTYTLTINASLFESASFSRTQIYHVYEKVEDTDSWTQSGTDSKQLRIVLRPNPLDPNVLEGSRITSEMTFVASMQR